MYELKYEKNIKKDLRKLDKSKIIYIKKELQKLAQNPKANPGVIKLQGNNPYYRLKLNYDLRVIFLLDDNILQILIVKIGHRKDIYTKINRKPS